MRDGFMTMPMPSRRRSTHFLAIVILLLTMCVGERLSAADYSGLWQTNWGALTLVQKGTQVTGSYPKNKGKVLGTVGEDGILLGSWTQTENQRGGQLRFVLSGDGSSFAGQWSYGDGKWEEEKWNGQRAAQPLEAPAVADFAGKWKTEWSAGPLTLRMNQKGNQVAGTYDFQGGTLQGAIDGKILEGTWKQKDGAKGFFRFTLTPDGEGFMGSWWQTGRKPGAWNGIRILE